MTRARTATKRPWLVFFGTSTTIVQGVSENDAYIAFLDQLFPTNGRTTGYYVPPGRDEVRLRALTDADLGWIDDSGDTTFAAAARKALA
jgi:hypothetical protein